MQHLNNLSKVGLFLIAIFFVLLVVIQKQMTTKILRLLKKKMNF